MSLFDNLVVLRDKLLQTELITTDNLVFKLNRLFTVTVLVGYSFLLSLSQYVGDPIDCIKHSQDSISGDTFDTICWVEGTYTQKVAQRGSHLGCYPGNSECWHHKYYQWVALFILLLAGFFYFPRFLWQSLEDGRIKSLITGLERGSLVRGLQTKEALEKGEMYEKIQNLVRNWKELKGTNNSWAWKYYICESLNLVNIILQFLFIDFFLGGQFKSIASGGFNVQESSNVLPITTDCFFQTHGSGGGMNNHTGLCILPLNMTNQVFFSGFFYLLSFLLIINSLTLVTRLIIVCLPEIREFKLKYVYHARGVKSTISKRSTHGDWLLLSFLLDNMNVIVRSQFLHQLGELKLYDED